MAICGCCWKTSRVASASLSAASAAALPDGSRSASKTGRVSRSEPVVEPAQARTTSSKLAVMSWSAVRADPRLPRAATRGSLSSDSPEALGKKLRRTPELGSRGKKAGPRPRHSVRGEPQPSRDQEPNKLRHIATPMRSWRSVSTNRGYRKSKVPHRVCVSPRP
jgi:hypothetical protein